MAVSQFLAKMPSKAWYVGGWKRVVEEDNAGNGAMRVKDPFDDFGRTKSVSEMRRDMLQALDRRINVRGGLAEANVPVDVELMRDADRVNDYRAKRIRFYQLHSKIGKKRCGHMVADRSEG